MLWADKANATDINKMYIELLEEAKLDCIFNDNIAESNIDQYDLHIKSQDLLFSSRIWFQVYGISEKKRIAKKNFSL